MFHGDDTLSLVIMLVKFQCCKNKVFGIKALKYVTIKFSFVTKAN